jgi:nitrite reductase/ring-hydroxylating ferredoxin subunit/uncharacterized membrane protein
MVQLVAHPARGPAGAQVMDALTNRIGQMSAIDPIADRLASKIAPLAMKPPFSLLGSGTWLGHPLHPVLTDLPIGCWTSAMALDLLLPRKGSRGARQLVGLGVLSAIPTAMTGLLDWSHTQGATRRVGAVHASLNLAAVGFYGLSWLSRRKGHHVRGFALGAVGGTIATAAAGLGGHLVYRKGTGVDVNAFTAAPEGWAVATSVENVAGCDRARLVEAGEAKVLATQRVSGWDGIGAICSHRGGPLAEGRFEGMCVTCPWHGSRFRLDDGSVMQGPATAPQPAYEVRERGSSLEVRAAQGA